MACFNALNAFPQLNNPNFFAVGQARFHASFLDLVRRSLNDYQDQNQPAQACRMYGFGRVEYGLRSSLRPDEVGKIGWVFCDRDARHWMGRMAPVVAATKIITLHVYCRLLESYVSFVVVGFFDDTCLILDLEAMAASAEKIHTHADPFSLLPPELVDWLTDLSVRVLVTDAKKTMEPLHARATNVVDVLSLAVRCCFLPTAADRRVTVATRGMEPSMAFLGFFTSGYCHVPMSEVEYWARFGAPVDSQNVTCDYPSARQQPEIFYSFAKNTRGLVNQYTTYVFYKAGFTLLGFVQLMMEIDVIQGMLSLSPTEQTALTMCKYLDGFRLGTCWRNDKPWNPTVSRNGHFLGKLSTDFAPLPASDRGSAWERASCWRHNDSASRRLRGVCRECKKEAMLGLLANGVRNCPQRRLRPAPRGDYMEDLPETWYRVMQSDTMPAPGKINLFRDIPGSAPPASFRDSDFQLLGPGETTLDGIAAEAYTMSRVGTSDPEGGVPTVPSNTRMF